MRISDSPAAANPSGNVQPATAVAPSGQQASAAGPLQDEASISSIALAASKSLETPESKIQELRAQYLDGTYKVDAKDLSAKIVDEHLTE